MCCSAHTDSGWHRQESLGGALPLYTKINHARFRIPVVNLTGLNASPLKGKMAIPAPPPAHSSAMVHIFPSTWVSLKLSRQIFPIPLLHSDPNSPFLPTRNATSCHPKVLGSRWKSFRACILREDSRPPNSPNNWFCRIHNWLSRVPWAAACGGGGGKAAMDGERCRNWSFHSLRALKLFHHLTRTLGYYPTSWGASLYFSKQTDPSLLERRDDNQASPIGNASTTYGLQCHLTPHSAFPRLQALIRWAVAESSAGHSLSHQPK